jgi:integrase/recombinase XerD
VKKLRSGQSSLISAKDYQKICRALVSIRYKTIFQLGIYTGERWGAIIKLKVSDVYLDPYKRIPRSQITFHKSTRKATPDGLRSTRQIKVHPDLEQILRAYPLKAAEIDSDYLFVSQQTNLPITLRTADKYLREALTRCGLDEKGISSHGTRRTFITRLHQAGASIAEIKKITGHRSIRSLEQYIDVSEERAGQLVSNFSLL